MPPDPPRQTKQQRIYEVVRERIVSGEYGPGFRVVIDAVAEEFDVSALPVREAVRRLEAEGLIVYRPNAGAHVAPADPTLFEEEMTVLAVLEGYATALAAPELRAQDLTELERITDQMVEAMETMDVLGFGQLNQRFHAVVYARCPNPSLVRMMRDVTDRLAVLRRTVFVQIPYRGASSVQDHRELVELCRRGAPASEIETAAREHKLRTVESFRAWKDKQASRTAAV